MIIYRQLKKGEVKKIDDIFYKYTLKGKIIGIKRELTSYRDFSLIGKIRAILFYWKVYSEPFTVVSNYEKKEKPNDNN